MTDPRELPEALQPLVEDEPFDPRMWGAVICGGLAVTIIIVCALWSAM
jgi:hypothetical protein